MARPCTVCAHAQRAEIDADLAAGTGSSEVARSYELSRHSIDRHRSPTAGHVPQAVLVEAWQTARQQAAIGHADLAQRLIDLAADATVVRLRAAATGRDNTVLRAIETERGLLADLAVRLGITSEDVRQEAVYAADLTGAYLALAREDPELLDRVHAHLMQQGASLETIALVNSVRGRRQPTAAAPGSRRAGVG